MKNKHLRVRLAQCELVASNSPCSRRKVGALIVDPETNVIVSEGYNGTPRGAKGDLCGGDVCLRESGCVESGTQNDVGCHHAEMNAILNAARTGNSTMGKWLMVNCDPCLMCAKAIHHAGISVVYCPLESEGPHVGGLRYLRENGVALQ
jgi:dCMP deaminase